MKWIFIILILPVQVFATSDTLAPHPMYFTVDGSPKTEVIYLRGKYHRIGWDGAKATLDCDIKPPWNYDPPNEGPPWDWNFWNNDGGEWEYASFLSGCLFIVGGSTIFFIVFTILLWMGWL